MKTQTDKLNLSVKIIRYCLIFLVCLVVFLVFGLNEKEESFDSVRFLDVGQGDSILIASNGHYALIDTATGSQSKNIVSKLRGYGVDELDALILTHPHNDHIGSADYILSKIDTANVICSGLVPKDENDLLIFETLKSKIKEKEISYYTAETGMEIKIGNFTLTVLLSDQNASEENDCSVVIMAKNGDTKFLLMGDAETPAENKLLEDNINLSCDVLKVAHHGSKDASCEEFLKVAKPEYAVISVGENGYGHPSNETLIRLISGGATVMRTDQMGDISFSVVENKLLFNRG